jgi:DNA polymerase-3 subunit gamma/tau
LRMIAFAPESNTNHPAVLPVATQPPAAGGLKKKQADTDWNGLIAALPLSGMEQMLAHHSELIAWHDGRIELRVSPAQRHLAERPYQEQLKNALEMHFGTKIRLEVSIATGVNNTIAELQNRENKQRKSVAAAAINNDPFVRDLIQNFDARVIVSSVKLNDNGERR